MLLDHRLEKERHDRGGDEGPTALFVGYDKAVRAVSYHAPEAPFERYSARQLRKVFSENGDRLENVRRLVANARLDHRSLRPHAV